MTLSRNTPHNPWRKTTEKTGLKTRALPGWNLLMYQHIISGMRASLIEAKWRRNEFCSAMVTQPEWD
jgi:hypothetical protein